MNRLSSETSPYLRQHSSNPVDWYPWSDEAFAAAVELDRPVMLSVGYSSCHWCHVMAHESFEDEQTAQELNRRFVSVKVDREERPDVDAVYMEAVQAVAGRGGWPMTVFLTPDRRPFYAGTYYPPVDMPSMPSFRRVLDAVDDAWRNRRGEVEHQADLLLEAVSSSSRVAGDIVEPGPEHLGAQGAAALVEAVSDLRGRFDPAWGGFGPAPKFPNATFVELCLQHHRLTRDAASLSMASRTLGAMASGGIYDHIGGGFHRYSTDDTWTVPHFEKMLYDQAALLRAYLHGWQVTGEAQWLRVVEETVAYVLRDLALPSGGICSSEDADSEGEEGIFYTWTPAEVSQVLGVDGARELGAWYGVTTEGNFERRSILRRPPGGPGIPTPGVEAARRLLFEARSKRPRPGRDDKVLTEWNAMFASVLAEAAGVTGRDDWARAAALSAEFLLAELRNEDGRWLRSWQDGKAQHLAYAADHAWVVELFTRLNELEGRAIWLERATECAGSMLELFCEDSLPLYTTGRDAERLVVRPMELADGATPSASSVASGALMRLGTLTGNDHLVERGESLLSSLLTLGSKQPLAVSNAVAVAPLSQGVTEVVVSGPRRDLVDVCRGRYEPDLVLAWGEHFNSPLWEGREEPAAYVCREYVCNSPSRTVEELTTQLDGELDARRSKFTQVSPT